MRAAAGQQLYPFCKAHHVSGPPCRYYLTTVLPPSHPNHNTPTSPRAGICIAMQIPLQVAIWAFTMVRLMPLNYKLLPKGEVEKEKSKEEIRGMLQDWGGMHAVRVALGAVALGGCAYGVKLLLK